MATTPNLGLRYPSATDAPDGPGAIYNLAMDIDGAIHSHALGDYVTLPSNAGYDTGQGICEMLAFGQLRIMSFAIYRSTGFSTSQPILTVNSGSRPSQSAYSGGAVYDNSGSGLIIAAAGLQLYPNGELHVVGWTPDSGNDGLFQGARGQITFLATN